MPANAILPFWLAWPTLAFILLVPGFLTLNLVLAFGKSKSALSVGERVFWTLVLGLFEAGWLALTLAELGIYSIGALVAILAGWSLVVGVWLGRKGYRAGWWRAQFSRPGFGRERLDGWLLAGLLLGTTGLFYLAPHETIIGAQDSGVYYNTGANIARTGAILIDDPLLQTVGAAAAEEQLGPRVLPQVLQGVAKQEGRYLFAKHLRLPAFFVRDNDEGLQTGEVVPQFFHLYPAALAIGYSLFGPHGALGVTPLLGILAVFAVYLTARRLFPTRRQRWIAPLAAAFLALNGIQVWFARQSLWEMLGQFLLFTGIYAFCLLARPVPLAQETDDKQPTEAGSGLVLLGGLGVGAAFGLICLAHAQFPFLVWAIAPYLVWMRLTRRWNAGHWWLLVTFGILLLHAILHIRVFSLAYFEGIYHHKIVDYRWHLNIIIPPLAIGFLGLVVLDAMPRRLLAFEGWVARRWGWVSLGLAFLTLTYLVYNYFIRVFDISTDGQGNYPPKFWTLSSYIGAPTTEGPERSLVRLGWYFSPLGMLLIFFGMTWLIARRLNGRTAFFLALLAGITVVFLDTNYTQEHYIYSLRRYVVATVPAFSLIMAYALGEALPDLLGWVGRWRIWQQFNRRVAYAQSAGGAVNNIAFAIAPPLAPEIIEPVLSAPTTTTLEKGRRWGNWLGLGLASILILFLFWTGRTIFTLSEYGPGDGQPGLVAQMDELASRFGPKDVVLMVGDRDLDGKFATPLTYAYGIPSFVLVYAVKNDEVAALMERWEAQGYHIKAMLGPNGGRFSPPGYELKLEGEVKFPLRQLEDLRTQKPYNIQMNSISYALYDVYKPSSAANFAVSAGIGRPEAPGGWNLKIGQSDYASLVTGFYEAEKDSGPNGANYRWVELSGVLRVPCLPEGSGGKLSVTLGAGTRPASKANPPVKVAIGNYRFGDETGKRVVLGTVQLKTEAQTFSFDLPAGAAPLSCAKSETGGATNSLIVWLEGDNNKLFIPANLGISFDIRQLNFKVYGLNLTSK